MDQASPAVDHPSAPASNVLFASTTPLLSSGPRARLPHWQNINNNQKQDAMQIVTFFTISTSPSVWIVLLLQKV
jgi:hypothetical protein